MSASEQLRSLQTQFLREEDPAERQTIIAGMLSQIEEGWNELFELIANEQNPERMLLLLAELDLLLAARQVRPATKSMAARAW